MFSKKIKLGVIAYVLISFFIGSKVFAENLTNELQQGRYVLIMMTGRGLANTRIPAMVLDSYRGIVWTCQNLQDEKPLWVKTDLAQNGDKPMDKKRYIARMLEFQDANLRMPAVVLDVEEGIVWNCPNAIDGASRWIQKDLKTDTPTNEKLDEKK